MLFNTLNFSIFFSAFLLIYWFLTKRYLKLQNLFILISSYFFYSFWDYRFLFLLFLSTVVDFYSGLMIEKVSIKNKKKWLWFSISINLGILAVFKYYNFFITSIIEMFSNSVIKIDTWTLQLILPVGISFYTFHGLSYIIDVYNNRIKAEKNIIDYAVFVSFFPLLVAGPIERATHLLPQVKSKRIFSKLEFVDGLKQILWGLFKKVVIADNCAVYANLIFNNSDDYSGSSLVLGAVLFAFQIYGDFSGYSDIAIGVAKLLGFDLIRNFSFPYFSRDIAEFWRRWHISLSSWFKDYVYIPLGGSNGSKIKQIFNVFVIFLLSGFWHGANWTFIFWGFLNAVYFLPLLFLKTNRKHIQIVAFNSNFPTIKEVCQMLLTFCLTTFAWIFFRARSLEHAFIFIKNIFTKSLFYLPMYIPKNTILLIIIFMTIEWFGRKNQYAISNLFINNSIFIRWVFYYLIIFSIFYYSGIDISQQFIYFQF